MVFKEHSYSKIGPNSPQLTTQLQKLLMSNLGSQGSITGPLLFLIYINGMLLVIEHANMHQFADNTNLLDEQKSSKKSIKS